MSQHAFHVLLLTTLFVTTVFLGTAAANGDEPDVAWSTQDLPGGDQFECTYRYLDLNAGVVRYVSRDSCSSEVYVNEDAITVASPAAGVSKCFGGNPTYCVDTSARCQVRSELVGIMGTDSSAYCVDKDGPCFVANEWSDRFGDSGRTCLVGKDSGAAAAIPLPCAVRVYTTGAGVGCAVGTGSIFWVAVGKDATGPYCYVTIGWDRYECTFGPLTDTCITDGTCDPCFSCSPAAAPAAAIPCKVENYGTGVGAGCWVGSQPLVWASAGDGFAGPYCYVTVGYRTLACEVGPIDCSKVCDNCLTDGYCDPCWSCFGEPIPAAGPGQCMEYYMERDFGAVRVVMRDSCHVEVYVLGEDFRNLLA